MTHKGDWKLFKKFLSYFHPYRYWFILAICFLFLAKVIEAFVPIMLGDLTDQILGGLPPPLSFLTTDYIKIFLILLSGYILDSLSVMIKITVGQKAIFTLRGEVYHHMIQMPLRFYDHMAVGRMMTRTIHDVDQINQMFTESMVPMIGNLFLLLGIIIGITVLDYRLMLIILVLLPAMLWFTNHFRDHQRLGYQQIRKVVAAMNSFVQEHLLGAAVVRSFGLQKKEREVFQKLNREHCEAHKETIRHFALFFSGIDLFQALALIAVFALLTTTAAGFNLQVGTFFAFSLYILMIFRPLMDFAERYNVLQASFAAAGRVFELFKNESEKAVDQGNKLLIHIDEITFENVWFSYDQKSWVYRGLSFSVKRGEKVGLVGHTGAGKTTILSLLLRFYPIQKGAIKINGININEYALSELRRHFSLVLQDPVLFSGTVQENITLFNSDIEAKEIAKKIGIRVPLSQTLLEQGKSLSLGERQLISMARSLAFNRDVLLFDEATANIDSGTERLIQKALHSLFQNKTAFIIAHRLSTIKGATRILVMKEGEIVEEGDHESLIAKEGLYEKFYQLQFVKYGK